MIDLCSIRKLQAAIREFEQTLKQETGLSLNDAMVLCAVRKDICDPGTLARELELSPSRLTRILDSLEQRRLICRRLSENDRRSILVSLTQEGTEMVEQYSCCELELPEELTFTQENQRI